MTRVKISVTADHIKRGKNHNPGACPVALAVLDAVMVPGVSVTYGVISLRDEEPTPGGGAKGECLAWAQTPKKALTVLNAVDQGRRARSCTFYLDFKEV